MKSIADFVSERMLCGFAIIFGYFALVLSSIVVSRVVPASEVAAVLSIIRDSLLAIGPLVGMIVQSIFKSDKVDRANAATAASLASTLSTSGTQQNQ